MNAFSLRVWQLALRNRLLAHLVALLFLVFLLGSSKVWAQSAPSAPGSPTIAVGNAQVTVTIPTSLYNCSIKRSTNWDGPYTTIATGLNGGYSYSDSNVTNGTAYCYAITQIGGYNAPSESAPSVPVAALPSAAVSPLAAPVIVRASAATTEVVLIWTQVPLAATYIVQRAPSNTGPWTNVASNLTFPNFIDTTVVAGTTYVHRVIAVKADNSQGLPSAPVITNPGTTISAPLMKNCTAGDGQVTVVWYQAMRATLYQIKRRQAFDGNTAPGAGWTGAPGANWSVVARVPATALSFTDTGLTNGVTYSYVISALGNPRQVTDFDAATGTTTQRTLYDEGPDSEIFSATPALNLSAPTDILVVGGNASASFAWTASAGATAYELARSTSATGPFVALTPTVKVPKVSYTGLTNGTTYYYTVTALGTGGTRATSSLTV